MHENKVSNQRACFVCQQNFNLEDLHINKKLNLPVCKKCHKSDAETKAEVEAINSLGDGFVSGCI